jgi:hypothetical protein
MSPKTPKQTGRGGTRIGAGRKAGEPRTSLSFKLKQTVAKKLELLATKTNKTKTEILESAIENFK